MIISSRNGGIVIILTLLMALILTILPLPDWAQMLRPQWYTLVLIYWVLALPLRVGVGIGWLVGIQVDVMTGTLLGQHALSLALIAISPMNHTCACAFSPSGGNHSRYCCCC